MVVYQKPIGLILVFSALMVLVMSQPLTSTFQPGRMFDIYKGGKNLYLSSEFSFDILMRIGSWNVRQYGVSKSGKPHVMSILADTFRRWDVALMMEITDVSNVTIWKLLDQINNVSSGSKYALEISPRLGYTNSKEQYGFFYRIDRVSVVDSYLYNDTLDEFAREPYNVLFEEKETGSRFFLIPIHTPPSDTPKEMGLLPEVFKDAVTRFGTARGVLLGDMNADCSYMSASELQSTPLRVNSSFTWLVPDSWDTTTTLTTDCAYDRIIVYDELLGDVVPNSTVLFNYSSVFDLNNSVALEVSDHYPVEFVLQFFLPTSSPPANLSPIEPPISEPIQVPATPIGPPETSVPTNIPSPDLSPSFSDHGSFLIPSLMTLSVVLFSLDSSF